MTNLKALKKIDLAMKHLDDLMEYDCLNDEASWKISKIGNALRAAKKALRETKIEEDGSLTILGLPVR